MLTDESGNWRMDHNNAQDVIAFVGQGRFTTEQGKSSQQRQGPRDV
jgi:hypothetical protein